MTIMYFDPVSLKCFSEEFVNTIQRIKMLTTEVHLSNLSIDACQELDNLEHHFTN